MSILFWLLVFSVSPIQRIGHKITKTKTIVERAFLLILINFHEPLEIKCNFQRPSSSDSPLVQPKLKRTLIF